jgi:heat shock protein HslJ
MVLVDRTVTASHATQGELSPMRILAVAAAAALLIAFSACTAAGGTGGTIEGPTWKLASQAVNGAVAAVPAEVHADARFGDGKVAGSGGCNVFGGPATISGAKITVGALISTQMACDGPAGDVETAYLANLAKAATFTATADALTIFDASGATLLVYAAGPANPLIGSWVVTGYNNGQQAVVSPLAGMTLTAVFTADAVSGNGGCNTYNGDYSLDGDAVTIGPLGSTRMACDQAVMDQETQLLAALQVPSTVEVSGGNVTLRDADGAMQVTLAPAP